MIRPKQVLTEPSKSANPKVFLKNWIKCTQLSWNRNCEQVKPLWNEIRFPLLNPYGWLLKCYIHVASMLCLHLFNPNPAENHTIPWRQLMSSMKKSPYPLGGRGCVYLADAYVVSGSSETDKDWHARDPWFETQLGQWPFFWKLNFELLTTLTLVKIPWLG